MSETRITRSKAAKISNVADKNANCSSVTNKNNQNNDSGRIDVKTKSSEMDPTPIKIKNIFNNFNNVRNISETTNRTVSTREVNSETENTQVKKCKELSANVEKMVMSSVIDLKIVRTFLEHVSGGDLVGLLSKLVTSPELDKLVETVGATEIKHNPLDDNEEVVAEVISDGESHDTNNDENLDLPQDGNDLPIISQVVGAHIEHDEVEVTRVIVSSSSKSSTTSIPSSSQPFSNDSISSSQSMSSREQEYRQLIQRYLLPVAGDGGQSRDAAQIESQMMQFLQQNAYNGDRESQMIQFLQENSFNNDRTTASLLQADYEQFLSRLSQVPGYENILTRLPGVSDIGAASSSGPSTSSSTRRLPSSSLASSRDSVSMLSASLSPWGVSLAPVSSNSATLTPMGVSLTPVTPVSSIMSIQTPPVLGYMEPASITPMGVSLTKVTPSNQHYSDPRSDLPSSYSSARDTVARSSRPPVIMSVESLSRSASVVSQSLAKSSARRFKSSAVLTKLTKASEVVVEPLDDDVVVVPAPQKQTQENDNVKRKKGKQMLTSSSEEEDVSVQKDDFVIKKLQNRRTRVKLTQPKRLNNIIEDSESESLEESDSEEEFLYEEADNENMQKNRKLEKRGISSKKRKNRRQDETSDSSESGRKLLRSSQAKNKKTSSEDEDSYSSDDMTEKAKRSRAFKQFKQQRSSVKKSSEKRKARIYARAMDSETDNEEKEEQQMKRAKKAKRNIFNSPKKRSKVIVAHNYIYSDSSDSDKNRDLPGFIVDNIESESSDQSSHSSDDDPDSDDEDFVVNDDDEVNDVDNESRKMMDSLKRRSEKFQNLNDDYENQTKCRQLGGYDDSDEESTENKYPPKLIDDLRDVRDEARKDDGNHLEAAEELSNDDVIREWEMYQLDESADHDGECVCGKTGLRWMFFMRNKKIQNWEFYTRIVGSECINWFNRANPNSFMAVLSKVAKDGCLLYYRKKLSSGLLLMTLGGNILPGFLAENQEKHKEEYSLPITVTKLKCGTNRVDVKIKPPPGYQGKGFEKVRDTTGTPLIVDQRYHAYLKPAIKPCKPIKPKNRFEKPAEDKKEPSKVEFVLVKIENLSKKQGEASKRPPTVKSFIK